MKRLPAAKGFWGTDGQYKYLHRWIKNQAGQPQHCERADSSCKGMFEWANKSGKYLKTIDDWARLCRSHHRRYDDSVSTHPILRPKTHCKRGHELSVENVRWVAVSKTKKARRCIPCTRVKDMENYYKRKELLCSQI